MFDVVLLTPHRTLEAFAQQLHDLPINIEDCNSLLWATQDGWVRCVHLNQPLEHGFDPDESAYQLMQQRQLAAFLVWYGHADTSQGMARQLLQYFLAQDAYVLDQDNDDRPLQLSNFLAHTTRF